MSLIVTPEKHARRPMTAQQLLDVDHDETVMSPELARKIILIRETVTQAKRGASALGENGLVFRYPSVDNIFDACRAELNCHGLIDTMELLSMDVKALYDIGSGHDRPAVLQIFQFVITDADGRRYANPNEQYPVMSWFEGSQTCGAARALAHKTALRLLFKIEAEQAEQSARSEPKPEQAEAREPSHIGAARRGRPPKNKPFMLGADESAEACERIITALDIAFKSERPATTLTDTWKTVAATYCKLAPADSARVSANYRKMLDSIDTEGDGQ